MPQDFPVAVLPELPFAQNDLVYVVGFDQRDILSVCTLLLTEVGALGYSDQYQNIVLKVADLATPDRFDKDSFERLNDLIFSNCSGMVIALTSATPQDKLSELVAACKPGCDSRETPLYVLNLTPKEGGIQIAEVLDYDDDTT